MRERSYTCHKQGLMATHTLSSWRPSLTRVPFLQLGPAILSPIPGPNSAFSGFLTLSDLSHKGGFTFVMTVPPFPPFVCNLPKGGAVLFTIVFPSPSTVLSINFLNSLTHYLFFPEKWRQKIWWHTVYNLVKNPVTVQKHTRALHTNWSSSVRHEAQEESTSLSRPTVSLSVTAMNINLNCRDLTSLKLLGEEGEILIFL